MTWPSRSSIWRSPSAMDGVLGRDLGAVVDELLPPDAVDSESLDAAARRFDEIAKVLSEALTKAQG